MAIDKRAGRQIVEQDIRKKKVLLRFNVSNAVEVRSLGSSVLKFTCSKGSSLYVQTLTGLSIY